MFEYNVNRNHLIIREYGRNIQKMIEDTLKESDYEKRSEKAKAIVRMMALINPDDKENKNQKESLDYWHKLWDHLFIMSDYKLDVDSPFPKPEAKKEELSFEKPDYNKHQIHYRTYGRNMENIIKKVSSYPDDQRDRMGKTLANHLKKLYLTYNRETVDDKLIVEQLNELSQGKISLPEDFELDSTRDILKNASTANQNKPLNAKKKSKKKKKKKDSQKENQANNK